jgi:hypothetical protein
LLGDLFIVLGVRKELNRNSLSAFFVKIDCSARKRGKIIPNKKGLMRSSKGLKCHHGFGKLDPVTERLSKRVHGQCGTQTEVMGGILKKCPKKMGVRARNDLKHHHEHGKLNPAV